MKGLSSPPAASPGRTTCARASRADVVVRSRVLILATAVVTAVLGIVPSAGAKAHSRADLVESRLGNPPARLAAGHAFTVTDVVSNRGPVTAGRSMTRYYLRAGTTSLLAGARRVPALRRGARSRDRVRLLVRAGAPGGRYWIVACVDATRRVREINERNNCRVAGRRLAVPGPKGAASQSSPPQRCSSRPAATTRQRAP